MNLVLSVMATIQLSPMKAVELPGILRGRPLNCLPFQNDFAAIKSTLLRSQSGCPQSRGNEVEMGLGTAKG